ncbi:MAG TPA: hypothetical protein VH598_16270 [Verrucomicrobiae bacterium]|nr:hypothetical protein [Verrucomicrobiae bacterium]
MKINVSKESRKPVFVIRVHLTDGSIESFAQTDKAEAEKLWQSIEPSRLFAQSRLVLAGEHSKSVFVTSQIVRVDLIRESNQCWDFPSGYSDVVELSEEEFRKNARLNQPERMAKRDQPTPVGDLLVSFLKLQFAGGTPLFLMIEISVKLPAENQSFMQFLLSKGQFHMRLRGGGVGIVNLANLLGYTVYPGVAQVPADTWFAEPVINKATRQ